MSDHVVNNTVTPSGIVLNLFDYWVTENQDDDDTETRIDNTNDSNPYRNAKINKDHQLKFSSSGLGSESNSINQWTHSSRPRSGIVKSTLLGGYPVLAANNIYTDGDEKTQEESLSYLFDKSEPDGKQAFWNVEGLLQVDSDGYYYYNADNKKCGNGEGQSGYQTANFAEFNKDTNRFTLYDSWGVNASGAGKDNLQGQFFPFNSGDDVFTVGGNGQLSSKLSSDSSTINHYFGMTMTTRFVQRYGGKTSTDSTAKDMTFEFAGDDDVWVFIDGILVCDLGGIHDQATTSINFATGEIKINNHDEPVIKLKDVMSRHYSAEENAKNWTTATDEDGNLLGTFADNTYHTLKLFYLERGGRDSNLAMKFNLAHVPETDGIKVDQDGQPLKDIQFDLYAIHRDAGDSYTIDTTVGDKGILASGTTNAEGKFVLNDGSEASIGLNELKQKGVTELLLRERGDREGYRPGEEFFLTLEDFEDDLLLLNDPKHHWSTGSYAQPKETVYVNPNISFRNEDGSKSDQGIDISDPKSGKMFAVIMRRMDNVGESAPSNSDQWGVVTGDALHGWEVTAPPKGESQIPTVLGAVQNRTSTNYFVFEPCSNGSYMTELNNCPGDMRNYYFWVEEKNPHNEDALKDVGYAIAYYYTTANSVEEATAENTRWVYSASDANFERQFSARLYIPNVKNYLRVEKRGDDRKLIPGAEFSLYQKDDVTVTKQEDGSLTYEIREGAQPYDRDRTGPVYGGIFGGTAEFPTENHVLAAGEYYLIETDPPEGYLPNPTPIHVIVNAQGVLADAGTAFDGVSVSVSEGTLVRTMSQFALSDRIDRTLTDVVAEKLVGAYDGTSGSVAFAPEGEESHLTVDKDYFNSYSILRYVLQDEGTPNSWAADEGWLWFRVRQDRSEPSEEKTDDTFKQDLKDTDLTPLFSGKTTVIVRDQAVGSLTISKTVETAAGSTETLPADQNFTFAVTLKNAKGAPLAAGTKFELVGGSTEGSGVTAPEDKTAATDANGTFTVTLKHGQRYTIDDLPVGTEWTVTEQTPTRGPWKTRVNGEANTTASDTIDEANEADEAAFLNIYGTQVIEPAVSTPIAVSKRYNRSDKDDVKNIQTVFTITAEDPKNAPMPEVDREVTITGEGTGKFGAITFYEEGTYTYSVSEKDTKVPGMIYDRTEYEVTFTVSKDEAEHKLVATPSYKVRAETAEQQPAEEVPVETPIDEPSENPTPENPSENPELKPGQSENPTQNPEQNPAENPAETPEQDPDKQPQQDPEPGVEENLTDQLTGESLQADPEPEEPSVYDAITGFTFVNVYRKPDVLPLITVYDALNIKKTYFNNIPFTGDVAFEITPLQGAPAPERTRVTITGAGGTSFGSIPFTEEGTFQYTVREIPGTVDGMTYDKTVYTVTITVGTKANEPFARVSYTANDGSYDYAANGGMVFQNTYTGSEVVPTTGTLRISKTVSGSGADQNGIFQFRVRVGKLNGSYGGVTFTDGTATVSVKAGSSVDITGLPAGASYSVTELSSAGYTVTSRNATGTIPDNATVTASFNNEKQGSGDSGGKDDGGDTPSLNREEHYAYIIGYKDGLLRPNGNISRAEVATIFFRLLRDPVRSEYWNQTNPYPDVPADMWCNNAISTLTNMGIISGYSDGTFRPNDPITRAELTKIAAGFFADKRVTAHYDGRFSDVSGSEWFVSALEKAIEEGIVQGYQDGTFAPDQYITRAQACTIINRTLGRKPETDRLLPESQMLTWPDSDPSAWYYAQMQEATNSHDYIWVTGSSGKVEKWTKKLPDRDWAALEHIWSRADSSTGGEAMN